MVIPIWNTISVELNIVMYTMYDAVRWEGRLPYLLDENMRAHTPQNARSNYHA